MQSVLVLPLIVPPVAEAAGPDAPVPDSGFPESFAAEGADAPDPRPAAADPGPVPMVTILPWIAPINPVEPDKAPDFAAGAMAGPADRLNPAGTAMIQSLVAGAPDTGIFAGHLVVDLGAPVETAPASGAAPSLVAAAAPSESPVPETFGAVRKPQADAGGPGGSAPGTGREPARPMLAASEGALEPGTVMESAGRRDWPSAAKPAGTLVSLGPLPEIALSGKTGPTGDAKPGEQVGKDTVRLVAEGHVSAPVRADEPTATTELAPPAKVGTALQGERGQSAPQPAVGQNRPDVPHDSLTDPKETHLNPQAGTAPEPSGPVMDALADEVPAAKGASGPVAEAGLKDVTDALAGRPSDATRSDDSNDTDVPPTALRNPLQGAGFWERLFTGLAVESGTASEPKDEPPKAERLGSPVPASTADGGAVLRPATAHMAPVGAAVAGKVAFAEQATRTSLPLALSTEDGSSDPAAFAFVTPPGTGPVQHGVPASNANLLPVPHVAAQITAALSQSADGATELALSPEELGHVRLRLERDAKHPDRMVVMITFERPETLDLFRRHAGELAEALRSAGYAGADIGFGQEGSGGQGFDRAPRMSGPQAGHGSGLAGGPEPMTPDPRPARLVAGASLDLRL